MKNNDLVVCLVCPETVRIPLQRIISFWNTFFIRLVINKRDHLDKNATPAQILQHILEKKWKLETGDKDMIVMWHKIIYELEGKKIAYF